MKHPGIIKGIVFATLASLASGLAGNILTLFVGEFASKSLVVLALSAAYVLFLMTHSDRRRGRVLIVATWLSVNAISWVSGISLIELIVLQIAFIWATRSLYFHRSVITVLLDLLLIVVAAAAGFWAIVQTSSFTTGVWCFFLAQSLFVAIPELVKPRSPTIPTAENDSFQNAHRIAQEAVRKLSIN